MRKPLIFFAFIAASTLTAMETRTSRTSYEELLIAIPDANTLAQRISCTEGFAIPISHTLLIQKFAKKTFSLNTLIDNVERLIRGYMYQNKVFDDRKLAQEIRPQIFAVLLSDYPEMLKCVL